MECSTWCRRGACRACGWCRTAVPKARAIRVSLAARTLAGTAFAARAAAAVGAGVAGAAAAAVGDAAVGASPANADSAGSAARTSASRVLVLFMGDQRPKYSAVDEDAAAGRLHVHRVVADRQRAAGEPAAARCRRCDTTR